MQPESPDSVPDSMYRLCTEVPEQPSGWIRLALELEDIGESDEAKKAWANAYILVPGSRRVQSSLERLGIRLQDLFRDPSEDDSKGAQEMKVVELDSTVAPERPVDLDALILGLQSGRPQGSEFDTVTDEGASSQETDEDVASETLAEIFESQGHFEEAIRIYEILARDADGQGAADVYSRRIEELRLRIP
jgi:hypothetical protein